MKASNKLVAINTHSASKAHASREVATSSGTMPLRGNVEKGLPGPGDSIGQYELIRELARGGMGTVHLARDTKLGRRVAIKFLQCQKPELSARFILEARATARCHHENIIVIHDVGEHHGNPYMVLEYLEGTPLTRLLGRDHSLSPGRVVELMVPVVRALACAHEHHIVHRDLKPDNIFVTSSGMVKVLDFGIAKLVQAQEPGSRLRTGAGTDPGIGAGRLPSGIHALTPDPAHDPAHDPIEAAVEDSLELTRRGVLVGTAPYMSPEQWGAGTIDHRTDIWAVGIILFRMLCGRHPLWPSRGRQLMVTGVLKEPMPRLRRVCPSVPDELADIVDRCLIKARDQRMGSAHELLDALEPLMPGRAARRLHTDQCPYAGLSSFQESDAGRFFGRTREIAAAVTRLREKPLLGVIGPSGVGKSSFVRAGLVPALKQSGETWTSLVIRPGRQPMDALVHLIRPMLDEQTKTVAQDVAMDQAILDRLHREPGYLGAVLRHRARTSRQKILVFVDQFEELYTLLDDVDERRAFTACLASVADDAAAPLRVVIALRSDFLDRAAEDERFMAELSRGLFFVRSPDRQGLADALLQPAEMAGYHFECQGMIDDMLDYLEHTSGALPLLQFAATKLWDMRDCNQRVLTMASYKRIGGIAGALASHADSVLTELSISAQVLARAVFLRLVTSERTRAIVTVAELGELSSNPGEVTQLVEQLVHARLLVVQSTAHNADPPGADAGKTVECKTVEIVHESLIHSWPLLKRWLDDNQDDALFMEQLRNTARQWDMRARPSGLLWRGEAMDEAKRWYRRYRGELPAVQRDYLQAVFAQGARAARMRRMAVAGVIALLSIMVAAATVALVLIREAQQESTAQADRAERQLERALAAEANAKAERERAIAASEQVARTNEELASKNAQLIAAAQTAESARHEAEAARARAEDAGLRASHNRRRAEAKEQEARTAEARAHGAYIRLQQLLKQERERIRQLEEQSGTATVIHELGGRMQ